VASGRSRRSAFVELNRKGRLTLVDPFGKVQRRARNGEIDQLLALVDLVEHVAPPRPATLVCEDALRALEGGACGVPLGLVGMVLALGPRRRRQPLFAPPSLAWEAQLTLPPLMDQLTRKLNALGPQSHQRALDEIAFYTAQLREVQAVVDARDLSPGRGHIGYRTFGAPAGLWAER
jgi:hypothetical protein